MSKAGRSVRAISSTRIWRQSGSINEVAGDSTVRSHRPTGPAFGRPEDRLHPVPISAMDPGLRRDDANSSGTPYSAGQAEGPKLGGTLTYVIAADAPPSFDASNGTTA